MAQEKYKVYVKDIHQVLHQHRSIKENLKGKKVVTNFDLFTKSKIITGCVYSNAVGFDYKCPSPILSGA